MSECEVVQLAREGEIAWITLNRPNALNALNALNAAVRARLPAALREADGDPEVRVIVLRGAGPRAFCAGADIREFSTPTTPIAHRGRRANDDWTHVFERIGKPLVAAIHGFCLGGGLEIALACDIRVATSDARLGLPEVSLGIIPGAGGTQRLSRVVGLGAALDMILTGEPIDAATAMRIGLISRIAEDGDVEALARRVAMTIAGRAPLAVVAAKEAVRKGADAGLEAGLRLELDLSSLLMDSEDRREAAAAFRDKRRPVFKGR
ncbi:MAG: enoyl-CoA hydratase-related protein [Acetobacteraceae bacterium]